MILEPTALPAAYWERRYSEGTTGWDRGMPSPGLNYFLDRAREFCWRKILVPGCGQGHEVIALAIAGFEVTALDYAETAVHSLQNRLAEHKLSAEVVQTDVLEFQTNHPFDAIYEQTCLCAQHPSQWKAYAQKLAEWLKPEGTFFAMFMQTTQPNGPPFACPLGQMRELFNQEIWHWQPVVGRIEHPSGLHEWACELRLREAKQE